MIILVFLNAFLSYFSLAGFNRYLIMQKQPTLHLMEPENNTQAVFRILVNIIRDSIFTNYFKFTIKRACCQSSKSNTYPPTLGHLLDTCLDPSLKINNKLLAIHLRGSTAKYSGTIIKRRKRVFLTLVRTQVWIA